MRVKHCMMFSVGSLVTQRSGLFHRWNPKTYQTHIGGEGGYLVCEPGKGIKPALVAFAGRKKISDPILFTLRTSCREIVFNC